MSDPIRSGYSSTIWASRAVRAVASSSDCAMASAAVPPPAVDSEREAPASQAEAAAATTCQLRRRPPRLAAALPRLRGLHGQRPPPAAARFPRETVTAVPRRPRLPPPTQQRQRQRRRAPRRRGSPKVSRTSRDSRERGETARRGRGFHSRPVSPAPSLHAWWPFCTPAQQADAARHGSYCCPATGFSSDCHGEANDEKDHTRLGGAKAKAKRSAKSHRHGEDEDEDDGQHVSEETNEDEDEHHHTPHRARLPRRREKRC